MVQIPPQAGNAVWRQSSNQLEIGGKPVISAANQSLYKALVEITGRYLYSCSNPRVPALSFTYDLRKDSTAFVKLDVQFEIIVGGFDAKTAAADEILGVVARYHHAAMQSMPVVPAVIFGMVDFVIFYIESMRGWGSIPPYFMMAAHNFLAGRLLPAFFEGNGSEVLNYVRGMRERGEDARGVLEFEPLIRNILAPLTPNVRKETIKQIGSGLLAQLGG